MVPVLHDYSNDRKDPSQVDRESWKGDKYSRKPPKDIFNPYSPSSRHPADRVGPSSRRWEEEDSSDDSYSSAGSGFETTASSPRLGRGIQSRGGHKTGSRAPPILTRPTLDSYHGSSNPDGLSESKPQQPWVVEPPGYKEKESARLPAQPSSSRADPRGRRADTNFVVGSYRDQIGGISGHPSDSQSRSSHKEKESARLPAQPSSSRADPRGRRADTNFVVGSYRDEIGGISGHPSDSQSRSSHKEKESARLPAQSSSSRADPGGRGADTNFVVGSYRGGIGGISGHPSDSQSRSSHKEKESARLSTQPSSSRADPRGRGADTEFVLGSYRGAASGGILGHPSDSQSRSDHREESARLSMQPSSNRASPRGRGADTDFVLRSYRGEASGRISGHPSDSQSRSGHREKESARLSRQPSSSHLDPRGRGTDTDFVLRSHRGEASGEISGHPSDSQSRSGQESARLPMQPSSNRADPRGRGEDTDFALRSYRGEASGRISGHPSDSQSRSGHREESARSPMRRWEEEDSSDESDSSAGSGSETTASSPRLGRGIQNRGGHKIGFRAPFILTRPTLDSYHGSSNPAGLSESKPQQPWVAEPDAEPSGYKEKESARLPAQPSSSRADPRGRGGDTDFVLGSYRGEASGRISGRPSDSQSRSGHKEESARSSGSQGPSRQEPRVRGTDADYGTGGQGSVRGYRGEASGGASGQPQPWVGKPSPALVTSSMQQPSGKQPEYTSGGSNRIPYIEQDNRRSTETMSATAHPSRFPPNPTTSIPRREEDSPPYHTRGSSWGREWSSQPADPSRTTPFSAFPPTRPPQHEAQHSHPSQVQGSLGSQRQEDTWDRGLEHPSGGPDFISNPSADATGPHPWGGQPTGPPPGWSAHPAHRVFFPRSLPQNF